MPAPVFSLLEKGSKLPYDNLIDLHDRLTQSADPFMQYAAGWAALYASQKFTERGSDEAFHTAQIHWAEVSETKKTSYYHDDPASLSLQAFLCVAIADQIRYERQRWAPEERQEVFENLGEVATECLRTADRGNRRSIGLLSEIACLQLVWRPSDNLLPLNAFPAGPAKDSREPGHRQFNTDIYAITPGISRKKKGANIQVKTHLGDAEKSKYDSDIIVMIGANTHFHHPNSDVATHTRVRFTAHGCIDEALGSAVPPATTRSLDLSAQNVHQAISESLRKRHHKQEPSPGEEPEVFIDLRQTSAVETK